MNTITPITLPTPIEWSTKEHAAKVHIQELETILAKPTNKLNYIEALAEVSIEVLIPNRNNEIVKYWYPYLTGDSLLQDFFTKWLTYTPTPVSPGEYIEYWDYLVNTSSGLLLANDDSFKLWFTTFLNFHGNWINSTSSTSTLKDWMEYKGTKAHPFDINDYEQPDPASSTGGFKSFNQFFLRNLKPDQRPLCDEELPNDIIVAPCDGGIFFLNNAYGFDNIDKLKNTNYDLPGKSDQFNLNEALPGYGNHFLGGDLLDILLWFTDYHHFHAPVNGTIVHQGMYHGSYNYDFGDYDPKDFYSPSLPADSDKVGWYEKLGKHQRYVWIIKTEKFGLVAMVAIGFWGVGSIINAVKDNAIIKQGDYMGHFGYGGSSIVLAFNKNINIDFKVGNEPVEGSNNPTLMNVRQCLGKIINPTTIREVINPTTLNQYISAGSYQLTSHNIEITITANCRKPDGLFVNSSITFSDEQAKTIGDIVNNGGSLEITEGDGKTPNPTNKFNEYIPAGSYQLTCSDISIEVKASCQKNNQSYIKSMIKFNISTSKSIVDILNDNGVLRVEKIS